MEIDITKIAVLALIGAVLSVVLKENKPVFSLMVAVITSLVIFIFVIPGLKEITGLFNIVKNNANIKTEYIEILVKSVVISYIAMFSSQLCRDFGQGAIGDKVELGAKITIMLIALPVITSLINTVVGML